MCFAPFNNPKIAVAVLVENAGFGATYAAPIAQKVVAAYLKMKTTTTTGVVAETGAD
jgi:penicillin-binding protein 2